MKYFIEFYKDKPKADVYTEHVDGLDETAIEAIDQKWLVAKLQKDLSEFRQCMIENGDIALVEYIEALLEEIK